jgi:hypothetical protein
VFLLIAAPIGTFLGISDAGAQVTVSIASMTLTPSATLTSPQTIGSESFAADYDTTVTGIPAAGYPEGQVTVTARGLTGADSGLDITLCQSNWNGSPAADVNVGGADDPTATPNLATPYDVVDYYCNPTSADGDAGASLLPVGTYQIFSYIGGDPTGSVVTVGDVGFVYAPTSTTVFQTLTIAAATPTLATLESTNSPAAGSTFTDTPTLTLGDPPYTGTVTYELYSNNTCTTAAASPQTQSPTYPTAATFTAPSTAGVTVYVGATYNGDTNNSATALDCEAAVTTVAATPSVSSTPTNAVLGSPIQDTVQLSGLSGTNATGVVTVTLQFGSCPGGPVVDQANFTLPGGYISGTTATFPAVQYTPIAPSAVGTYYWTVTYPGDANNGPATGGGCGVEESTVSSPAPPSVPAVNAATLPNGIVGSPYSVTLTASGGVPPYHAFTVSSGALPPGLNLAPSTGIISGTPLAGDRGTYDFSVTVQDSLLPTNQTSAATAFTITIGSPLVITAPSRLPGGNHGRMYTATVTTSGGITPLHFAITGGKLPPGLGINGSTGVITGPAGATGTYTFTVTVTDSGSPAQSVSKTFTITIS